MDYNEFCDAIKKSIESMISCEGSVELCEVIKNNDIKLTGIVIRKKDEKVSPNIYLEPYYMKYKKGDTLEKVAECIINKYEECKNGSNINADVISDFSELKDNLLLRLVNKGSNEKYLKNLIHKDFLDLSLVVYADVSKFCAMEASVNIKREYLHMWDVSEEEVFDIAYDNTFNSSEFDVINMADIGKKMFDNDTDFQEEFDGLPKLYVLTNLKRIMGAVAMACEEKLKKLAEEFNENLFVIPSSVHEVIVVPDSHDYTSSFFDEMIQAVNAKELSPEEILSDHVYYFDRNEGYIPIGI